MKKILEYRTPEGFIIPDEDHGTNSGVSEGNCPA